MLKLFVATFSNVGGPLTPLTFSTIKVVSLITMVQNAKFLKLQHPTYNIMTCNKAPTTCVATLALARDQGKGVASVRAYK